jgi:hypothetical protein
LYIDASGVISITRSQYKNRGRPGFLKKNQRKITDLSPPAITRAALQ